MENAGYVYFGIDFCTEPQPHLFVLKSNDTHPINESEYEEKELYHGSGGKVPGKFKNDFKKIHGVFEISVCPQFIQHNCGNGRVDANEQCEPPDAKGCDGECRCSNNLIPVNGTCRGCGNGMVDKGEFCDGEEWCHKDCMTCAPKYVKLGNSCFLKSKFIAIIVCCVLALIIIIVAPIVVCVL